LNFSPTAIIFIGVDVNWHNFWIDETNKPNCLIGSFKLRQTKPITKKLSPLKLFLRLFFTKKLLSKGFGTNSRFKELLGTPVLNLSSNHFEGKT
jgi:hypothetical protein